MSNEMFFAEITSWHWQTPDLLWLALWPIVLGFVKFFWSQKQQISYAEKHLWQWVKVSSTREDDGSNSLWQRLWAGFIRPIGLVLRWLIQPRRLIALAWMSLVIALAGPRVLVSTPETSQRSGVDILIAMDLSRSMLAEDVKPSRFLFSKSLVESFVNRLQPDDRLGLMVFAGKPHLVSPLTFDRALFHHYLNLIEPNMLPTQGSLIKPAVSYGIDHLKVTAGRAAVLVVLTDGEPEEFKAQDNPSNFDQLKTSGVATWLIGVGAPSSATIPDAADKSGRLHYRGLLVSSRLESLGLQQLAKDVGGQYFTANEGLAFLDTLLKQTEDLADKRTFSETEQQWRSYASGFIGFAVFLLIWAFYGGRGRGSVSNVTPIISAAVFGVCILASTVPATVWAEDISTNASEQQMLEQAYKAFSQKEYDAAQQYYDVLANYQGWFGAGASAYRAQDYESAVMYFRQAAVSGISQQERGQALYNLGNAYYQVNLMAYAIEAYEQALIYLPEDEKTRHNLALAKQRRAQEKGQQQAEESGDGEGSGSKSREGDGAFYGGQKPNDEPGEGASGDAPEGNQDGKESVLPTEEDRTQFNLAMPDETELMTEEDTQKAFADAILAQQRQQLHIEKFEQKMQGIQDQQIDLLKRLFEREEGFQAPQDKPLEIPGVKPW